MYLVHSHFFNGSSKLLSFLFNLLHSSSIRQQASVLQSLKPVFREDPSIVLSPAFLHSFTQCLSSPHNSVLDQCLDTLLLHPSLVQQQGLLYRTVIQKSLHLSSVPLQLKAYQLATISLKHLFSQSPLNLSMIQSFLQVILKHLHQDMSDSVQETASQFFQILWCIDEPSPEIQSLQQQFVSFIQTAQYSIIPQDNFIVSFVIQSLKKESVQPFLTKLLILPDSISSLSEANMRVLSFIVECVSSFPPEFEQSVIHGLDEFKLFAGNIKLYYLRILHAVLNTVDHSILPELHTLFVLLEEVELIELMELLIKSIVMVVAQTKDIELSQYLAKWIDGLSSSDEDIIKRSVIIVGYVYQELTRSLYMNLVNHSSSFELSSIAILLEQLFTTASPSLHLYCLSSYYRCLSHNPGLISSSMMNHTIDVCFLSSLDS